MNKTVCYSHIGKRLNQEDNFFINGFYLTSDSLKQMSDNRCCFINDTTLSKVRLFAVSDGMGGHNAGEIASRICVERLAVAEKGLQQCNSIKDAVDYLQAIIAEINNTVCNLSRKHDELKGMGATLVLFVVCGKDCAVLNVGDSRAYHFYNDVLSQITKDHTEGQRMLDFGLLTRKELSGFPARKNLNRYIGYGQNGYILRADEYYPALENGIILLCSDGISDFIPDSRISEILCSEKNLEIAGKQLINEAVAAHNADNATAMLIHLGGDFVTQTSLIGKDILGYTVSEKLGSGAFGTVYKVIKTNAAGQYVRALKHITIPTEKQYNSVLNSMGGDVSKADSYFSQMLNNIVSEIRILNDLSEKGVQHIVRYYENDILVTDSPRRYDIFILMEYLTPLEDFIQSEDFLVRDVVRLGLDVLYGLRSCHDNGVIHRDIKDDNIFVSDKGEYKIGDFGVSKVLKDSSKAESLKGTPNFLAPEVYLGKEGYTKSVDLYSLGIVLYRLLNYSRNPFLPRFPKQYFAQDEDAAFERRMSGKRPARPVLGGEQIGRVIVKAISNSSERFQTADEFINALEWAVSNTPADKLDEKVKFVVSSYVESSRNPKSGEYSATFRETASSAAFEEQINDERNNSINKHLFESIGEIPPTDIPEVEPVIRHEHRNESTSEASKTSNKNNFRTIVAIALVAVVVVGAGIFVVPKLINGVSEGNSNETGGSTKSGKIEIVESEETVMGSSVSIVSQPVDVYAIEGDRVAVMVEAEGEGLSYQWWIASANDDTFIESRNHSSLYTTILNKKSIGRQVYCVITDSFGHIVTTDIVTLNERKTDERPIIITKQPESVIGSNGDILKISVVASGKDLEYQWWSVPDATSLDFQKTGVKDDSFEFTMSSIYDGMELVCVITDAAGNYVITNMVQIKMS